MSRDTIRLRTREVQIERLIAAATRVVRGFESEPPLEVFKAVDDLAEALSVLGVDARRERR